MHPTRRALKVGGLILAVVTAIACQRTPELEETPKGTAVTIKMQDGRLVTGSLVSVDPEMVVVSGARPDGRIWVTRTNIADVQSGVNATSRPALREVTVPARSTLDAQLDTSVASDTSSAEEPIQATLMAPLVAEGVTLAPIGSTLLGTVTSVRESGRVRGRAEIGLRFNRLRTGAVTYDIRTAPMRWVAQATKGEDEIGRASCRERV